MTAGRLSAVAGLLGTPLFVVSWLVAGDVRSGYDPRAQAISELAELGSPTRWIVTLGLIVFGVLTVAFAPSVGRVLRAGAAAVAVAVNGAATVMIALFPCTAGCPGADASASDLGHMLAATVAYVALVLAPLVAALTFARRGERSRAVTSAAFALVTAAVLLSWLAGVTPDAGGTLQRVATTTGDAWFVVAATWCLRTSFPVEGRR